jgi:hypothetical protein
MSVPDYFEATETPGGTKIATDGITDIDSLPKRVQYVKLMDGTLGGTDKIPGTAARGLLVESGGYGSSIRSRSVNVTVGGGLLSALGGIAALANRKNIMLVNLGTQRIWLGHAAANAFWPIDPNVPFTQDWASAIDPYLISSSGTQALSVLETA